MDETRVGDIDRQLADWQQGDVVISDTLSAIHLTDLARPGTAEAAALAGPGAEGLAVVAVDVPGLVVLSQTCDIVRSCAERPYVEVCPLAELPAADLALVRRSRRPQYAAIPGLGERPLVADLDRVFTIEKAALAAYCDQRVRGLTETAEVRDFADAIARKRARIAFPDDFVALVAPMQSRIIDKHARASEEGRFLNAVREIRVKPDTSWDAEQVAFEILFVFETTAQVPDRADEHAEALMARIVPAGRFTEVSMRIVGLDQISAATYLESDRLDLEHLSKPRARAG